LIFLDGPPGQAGGVLLFKGTSEDGCAGISGVQLPRPPQVRASRVRVAAYLLVVLTAGAYLPSPLYAAYQHEFGFSDLLMTLIYATFALVSAPALVLFGSMADGLGPRVVLRSSTAVAAVASLCFALATGPEWLLAGRAAQGLALGAATGAATKVITTNAAGGNLVKASVLASAAFAAGTAAGPVAAGLLAQHAPAPHVLPFAVHLLLLAHGWHRASVLPGRTGSGRWKPARPRIPAGMRLLFTGAAATGFLSWTAAGLFMAVVPAVLERAAGVDDLAVLGGIVSAVMICSMLSQPLVARCGAGAAQLTGLAALLVSLAALAASGGSSLLVVLLAAVTAGVGHGLAYSGANAAIDAAVPEEQRASTSSALYLAFYLGSGIPPVAVGLLTSWHPLPVAISWLSTAAAALVPLTAIATALAARRRKRARSTRSPALSARG